MKDRTLPMPGADSGRRRDGLQVGQVVEVKRGLLTGMCGVLVRFTAVNRCLIELNCQPRGVLIVIDVVAVAPRPPKLASKAAHRTEMTLSRRGTQSADRAAE